MYTLREYQTKASNEAIKHFTAYRKPFILDLSTGAGKSLIIADIAKRLGDDILVLVPSKELLEQNYQKMIDYGIEGVTMFSASVNKKEIGNITLATIGSIYKKPEEFKHFKYVIVDECHGINSKGGMYMEFFKAIGMPKICGLTATPYRLDQIYVSNKFGGKEAKASIRMINRIRPYFFGSIVYKKEMWELIKEGYLSPIEYKIDLGYSGIPLEVNTTGGDYTTKSLEAFADHQNKRLIEVVRGAQSRGMAKRGLIFISSAKRAQEARDTLRADGIDVEVVTADTKKKERERIVADYREGKLRWLINFGVFTTGLDVPEIDCIIMARPTMSVALVQQMIGRGVRLDPNNPDKVLKVIDMAGVYEVFGDVANIRVVKEDDGFRDCLIGDRGRIDNQTLYTFKIPEKKEKNG